MTTWKEHVDWILKYASEFHIWHKDDKWSCSAIVDNHRSFKAGGYADRDECTRVLCDEICEYLGDRCK
jgi:hypothetical protein